MNRHAQHGFTLLELLVSMAIFGLVLALAMSVYHFYTEQWQQRSQRTDIHAMQARQFALVQRSVEAAFDHYVNTPIDAFQQQQLPLFHTEENAFRYVTLASVAQPGAPALAELRLEEAGDGQRLTYHEWPLHERILEQADPDWGEGWQLTLFDGIEQASFSYLGYANRQSWLAAQYEETPATQSEPLQWYDDYHAKERELLPMAVRIELRTKEGEHYPLLFLLRTRNPAKALFLGDEALN